MSKSLEIAFSILIKTKKWYEHSLRSSIQAKNDKATFLKNRKIPEERIRDYLSAAGWICVQVEQWNSPNVTLKATFSELIKTRKWYEHSPRSPFQAKKDKSVFLRGKKVAEERIRDYLLAAGYKIIQNEQWEKM